MTLDDECDANWLRVPAMTEDRLGELSIQVHSLTYKVTREAGLDLLHEVRRLRHIVAIQQKAITATHKALLRQISKDHAPLLAALAASEAREKETGS